MEGVVLALLLGGERNPRGDLGIGPEHREFLEHEAQLVVIADQLFERRLDLFAVGTPIVEELDQRHIAIWVAGDRGLRVAEYLLLVRGERLCRFVLSVGF